MRIKVAYGSILVITMLAGAACGYGGTSAVGGSGGADPQLAITSPADGTTVRPSFTLTYDTSVELGPTDSGQHHVHVFVDGQTTEYAVVPTNRFRITNLEPGEHTVHATLQHADHSPAGAEDEITLTVGGSGGAGGTSNNGTSPGGGYSGYGDGSGYGY